MTAHPAAFDRVADPLPPSAAPPALPEHAEVAAAISYLVEHYQDQPSLEAVALRAGLSPHHFQRVFKRWAGISPKRFLQYVTVTQAKRLLVDDASVLAAALETGLSGPSRLHDLFVACEAMTPGEYKACREQLTIRFGLHDGPLGRVLIGGTERGICWLSFVTGGDAAALEAMEREWAGARTVEDPGLTRRWMARAFRIGGDGNEPLPLLLKGTNFQIKVWEALLRIPFGRVVSYQAIAEAIGNPKAVRAVGRAVGANNLSWLIPCHRVILGTGIVHNYRWGTEQKNKLLTVEATITEASHGPGVDDAA